MHYRTSADEVRRSERTLVDQGVDGDLAQRDLVAKMLASNDAQYGHVNHSDLPLVDQDLMYCNHLSFAIFITAAER
ncbi:hypothetical protein CO705_06800 [Ralstonia pickettii]|nr:hypothetical protein CO705_06800 [Ralstonia pickettii]